MSEQTVKILIRLLLRSSLIRIYTVCHSFYIFWRHYFIVKLNCFILRTTTVAGLGVPIFRVFTVSYDLYVKAIILGVWNESGCFSFFFLFLFAYFTTKHRHICRDFAAYVCAETRNIFSVQKFRCLTLVWLFI